VAKDNIHLTGFLYSHFHAHSGYPYLRGDRQLSGNVTKGGSLRRKAFSSFEYAAQPLFPSQADQLARGAEARGSPECTSDTSRAPSFETASAIFSTAVLPKPKMNPCRRILLK